MSRYYVAPVRPSGESPIADALSSVGESAARTMMQRRQVQAERENDAIAAAIQAERDRVSMAERGWSPGEAPTLPQMTEIEALPSLQQPPMLEPAPEDPVGEALRSYGPQAPTLENPFANPAAITRGAHPDYIQASLSGNTYHKQTPAAKEREEQKKKDADALAKRQRDLTLKSRELGAPDPDWSTSDPDEVELALADARRRDGLARRATSVGHRAPMPGEDLNAFQAAVESAETRNAQSIQANRFADDARMERDREVDARVGRLASAIMHIKDPAAASRAANRMLTSRDRQLGISPIDVTQRARVGSGGGRDADPKAEARKVWEQIRTYKVGSSGATRERPRDSVLREWAKLKPELTAIHGETFVADMESLINQLAATRPVETKGK